MTPKTPNESKPQLYGLYLIIVVQVLATAYLLIDDFFVSDEPQHGLILGVAAVSTAIIVGLFIRNNFARQAMVVFACISIASEVFRLGIILFGIRSGFSSELLMALLTSYVIPIAFTIWIVIYLTNVEVQRQFSSGGTGVQDENQLREPNA